MYIKDWKIFWKSLKNSISQEHQVSKGLEGLIKFSNLESVSIKWQDVGTEQKYLEVLNTYQSYDFSKTDEFTYFVNKKVIKFFNNSSISLNRFKKTQFNKNVFPSNVKYKNNFISYDYMSGTTLYENNNNKKFENLLSWLDTKVWINKKSKKSYMNHLCKTFYFDKSMSRINQFFKINGKAIDKKKIQGLKIPSIGMLFKKINWENLYKGIPSFIHGDLHFDNLICKSQKKFYLIDWRHDFFRKCRIWRFIL